MKFFIKTIPLYQITKNKFWQ